jgi:hypothetical protein
MNLGSKNKIVPTFNVQRKSTRVLVTGLILPFFFFKVFLFFFPFFLFFRILFKHHLFTSNTFE